ncbi:hypothetical protein [Nostoc sp.]|uniref:hypothetical protein n=1 Tax=Nostoc sp. TaxID=1180 RepID=UPI002FF58211
MNILNNNRHHLFQKKFLASIVSTTLIVSQVTPLAPAQTIPAPSLLPTNVFPVLTDTTTAVEYLKAAPKPVFKANTLLPRLTLADFATALDIQKLQAESWDYALDFGLPETFLSKQAKENPTLKLAASNLKIYPLAVRLDHSLTRYVKATGVDSVAWVRDKKGNLVKDSAGRDQHIFSPETPGTAINAIGNIVSAKLAAVNSVAPIAMVMNFGEDGVGVIGWQQQYWKQDPKIVGAKGTRSWFDYISEKKSIQESHFKHQAIARVRWNGRPTYIYYQNAYTGERGRWWGWRDWMYDFTQPGLKNLSTYASPEHYYGSANSGWTGVNRGSRVPYDMLTELLNTRAGEIKVGRPFSYGWVTAGWKQPEVYDKTLSTPEQYMGFLKSAYMAGMVGAAAGYFDEGYLQQALRGKPIGKTPPSWLWQRMVLSHVHALFTQVDTLLLNSSLVASNKTHPYSVSTEKLPLYELPAEGETQQVTYDKWGPVTIPTARVLARKSKSSNEWLISAWANTGKDRTVAVTVPGLGRVHLLARTAGSVYRAKLGSAGKRALTLLDRDPMYPSATFAKAVR